MKPLILFALISLIALPGAARARTEKVPDLAVENSCRDAKIYGMNDPEQTYKNCMRDEQEAKAQLEKNWPQYKATTRRACMAAGAHPSPSYVELLTCIEMTEEILKPPAGDGTGSGRVPGGGTRLAAAAAAALTGAAGDAALTRESAEE